MQLDGKLVGNGLRFDAALAIWVLQHSFNARSDIELIRSALKPAAALFVLNNTVRAVPTKEQPWVDDGFNVKQYLQNSFATK